MENNNYGVAILSKVKSVYVGNIYSVEANEELQNGFFGHLGDYKTGEREIRTLEKPTVESIKTKGLVLVDNPEINYDESSKSYLALQNYKIGANKTAKAYEIDRRDSLELANIITPLDSEKGAIVGNYVIPTAGSFKLIESATAPLETESAFLGKIIGKRNLGVEVTVGNPNAVSGVVELIEIEILRNLNA